MALFLCPFGYKIFDYIVVGHIGGCWVALIFVVVVVIVIVVVDVIIVVGVGVLEEQDLRL